MARGRARVDVDINQPALRATAEPKLRRAANDTAREIRDVAKKIVPVRTGRTKRSITAHRAKMVGRMHATAAVSAGGAAKFLVKGTKPHVIRARRAKALHFYVDGREVFAKSVNHPGTKSNDFLGRAADLVAKRRR